MKNKKKKSNINGFLALFFISLIVLSVFISIFMNSNSLSEEKTSTPFVDFVNDIPEDDFKSLMEVAPDNVPFRICSIDNDECAIITKGKIE